MFSRARWRLTIWFAGAVALIVAVIGVSVYFTARAALFDQVNDDLEARAHQLLQGLRQSGPLGELAVRPGFAAGGYFYALVNDDGRVIRSTENLDPGGLADPGDVEKAAHGGPIFADTRSPEGEDLRLYLLPVRRRGEPLVLVVGRSTEPERQALGRLVLILGGGAAAGLLLALAGGFFLAGRALRPIQTAMERQREFVADASHELRTPLSLIRANAEVLKRERRKPVQANVTSVDDIIQETDRLSKLVGQMLSLARADASEEGPAQPERVDLSELVADTVRQMRLLAAPKQVSIEVHSDGPAPVQGDAMRLRELLAILLDNSIKYSDVGSSLQVSVSRSGGNALLQVADRGRGIPKEALPRIFDRFYRVDKARSRELAGSGLGLAIAKWIVNRHKGTIEIESAPGQGTTVTVALPAASEG